MGTATRSCIGRAALAWATALLAVALLASGSAAIARDNKPPSLTRIDDMRELAQQVARERRPLLLFFSTPGCPFCLEVRRNYLTPRVSEEERSGVVIREIDITSPRTFIGLDGKPMREADFARQHGVRMVPYILLVDQQAQLLTEPLIGIDASGFYEARLSGVIQQAVRKLMPH